MAILTFPSILPNTMSFGIRYNTQVNISTLSGSTQTIEIPGARWMAELTFSDMEADESRVLASFLAQLRGASGRFYLTDYTHPAARGSLSAPGAVTVDVTLQTSLDSGIATGGTTTTLVDSTATFISDGLISAGDWVEYAGTTVREIISFTETTITINGTWTPPTNGGYIIYPAVTGSSVPTTGWNTSQTDVLKVGDYIEIENTELKMINTDTNSDASGNATLNFDPPIRIDPSHGSTVTLTSCRTVMLLNEDENMWTTNNPGLLTDISLSCVEAFD